MTKTIESRVAKEFRSQVHTKEKHGLLRSGRRSRNAYLFREVVRKGYINNHYYNSVKKCYVYTNPKTGFSSMYK